MRTVPEWIGKTPDSKVPPHVRMRIFLANDGKCWLTGRKIMSSDYWDLEHKIALCNGGEHRESNLAPALRDAHRIKTASDVREKAKVDRIRKRHIGIKKPRSILGWKNMRGEPVRAGRERCCRVTGALIEMPRTISDEDDGFGPNVGLGTQGPSKDALRKQLAEAVANTGGKPVNTTSKKTARTSQGLRDILFDQIDEMRFGEGDPQRALAIANIAKQILNTARVELDFHRVMHAAEAEERPITLGNLKLGSDPDDAASVKKIATER